MSYGVVGAVKVKPLVWVELEKYRHGGKYSADGYTIRYVEGFFILDFVGDGKWEWRWTTLEPAKAAAQADYEARIMAALDVHPITVQDAVETDAERFDRADWFWRVMDPDDSADTPAEAIHRGMIGDCCVCEIASSYTGPVRFGFTAPVLDPDSDDTEFLHFETQQKAIDAAKARAAALRAITDTD